MLPQIHPVPQGWARRHPRDTLQSRGLVPAVPSALGVLGWAMNTQPCPARRVPRGCRRRRQEVSQDVENVLPRRRMLNRSWERELRGRRVRRGVPGPGGCFPWARVAVTSCTGTLSPRSLELVCADTCEMTRASLQLIGGADTGVPHLPGSLSCPSCKNLPVCSPGVPKYWQQIFLRGAVRY